MRIIYNTSFIINQEIEEEWIAFIREHYLSVVRQHGLCEDVIFTRVSIDQPEGKTYSLQLVFNDEARHNHFLDHWLPAIEEKIIRQYANRYVCFSSVLTEI